MSDQNKMIVRRAIEEVYNQGKLEVVDDLVSSDFVARTPSEEHRGPVGIQAYVTALRAAFPDLQITIDDQIAEGDKVVTRWTARGTHTGTFRGIPPTGKQGSMTGIDIDRIVDGKAVECWTNTDDLGLLQQLGVVPGPGARELIPADSRKGTRMTKQQQAPGTLPDIEVTRAAWDQIASGYDAYVTPSHFWLAEEALRRLELQPGARFLDIASGSGALSLAAARRGAQVTATDLSPKMIERLETRARAEGLSNVRAEVMDGHNLLFEDDRFDAAGSQFGIMLFPDLPRALREMVRVTRLGGRIVMVTFGGLPQEVEFLRFFMQAAHQAVPDFAGPPMDPPPLPFQVADPAKLQRELELAGVKAVIIERLTESLAFSSADEMLAWLANSNPIGTALIRGLSDTQRQDVREVLDRMLRERAGSGTTARLSHPINIGIGTV